jgi:hypothetical protein
MGREHERSSKRHQSLRACGAQAGRCVDLYPQSRGGTILELRPEAGGPVGYPNWIARGLFPLRRKKIEKDEVTGSLIQPIMDAQQQ